MKEGEEMKTQIGEQFIHTGTHSVDAAFGVPKEKTRAEKYRLGLVLKVSIVLFALATIGVSSWGIYESVRQTESTVSDFWDLYRMVEVRANQTLDVLKGISGITQNLDESLDLLVRNEDGAWLPFRRVFFFRRQVFRSNINSLCLLLQIFLLRRIQRVCQLILSLVLLGC